jgi:hypothetical protein
MQSDIPLAATLARAAALDEHLVAELGSIDDGWFGAATLTAHNSRVLDESLARAVARYSGAERRVSGTFFIGEYAWYLAGAVIACYLTERRVPDLAAVNVALRFRTFTWHEGGESGEAERLDVRLLSGRFAALPDDPAADHPDALRLPDISALREWLRIQIEAHLTPLIAAIQERTRLGQRAQWNLAADALAALFQHAGEKLGDEERARAEGLALIKVPGSPLRNRDTGYITLEYQDHRETFRQRGGCCLYYKVEPGNNCSSCVLRPEEERNQMLLGYMAEKYAKTVESVILIHSTNDK